MNLKEAIQVYKEYLACPECQPLSNNPQNDSAVYHVSTFTHSTYTCKDCNKDFAVPKSVKLSKPQFDPNFKPNSKPEFKKR